MNPLDPKDLAIALATLPTWSVDEIGKLHRRFLFEHFRAAFAFMTRVAIFADAHDHHPEWSNVYNRVDVWLTTHDAGGITARDIALAREMERAAAVGA